MDKGAHFFRCDFQVHTPRDIRWTGQTHGFNPNEAHLIGEPEKEEEIAQIHLDRAQFAKEYLQKIRESGLRAIAVTDHHDVVFAKLIRRVCLEENQRLIAEGLAYDQITVFPGVELTLATPTCQCLLIFDADFPDESLDSVIHFLGFNPNHEVLKSTAQVERISTEIIPGLVQFHKKLDELAYCKGRYIILPNVSYNGGDSILRQGFHEHYRKMPCVGGYVDRDISQEAGYVNKLNGGDINYGNKAIGVLSTSDNRYEDGRLFGQHSTWIKWAEPSAEALRQACLAKESRLSQTLPDLPKTFISRIEVTNSKFISPTIELNRQYNVLIGGRGTGKSTILEYLRWGLCDIKRSGLDLEEQSRVEQRSRNLIEKTLVPYNGEVRVTFHVNGINHIVKRSSSPSEILLKIGEDNFQKVTEEEVRRLLPIQAYSQKQLSNVGIRTEELKRFVQQPIAAELTSLRFQLSDDAKKLRTTYTNYLRKRELAGEIDQFTLEIASLGNQVNSLRESLTGLSAEDQEVIANKQKIDNEHNFVSKASAEIVRVRDNIDNLIARLDFYPDDLTTNIQFENRELVTALDAARSKLFSNVKEKAKELKLGLETEALGDFVALVEDWKSKKDDFEALYEVAKTNASSNQSQLEEIRRIETRLQALVDSLNERKSTIRELGDPETEFETVSDEWYIHHRAKIDLLSRQSALFSTLSKGSINVEVSKCIDFAQIKVLISSLLQGTRINEEKISKLCKHVAEAEDPLDSWKIILSELRTLCELYSSEDTLLELPDTPILTVFDFNETNKTRIVEVVTPDDWVDIATTEIEFDPQFKYVTSNQMGDTIPFADASAGQQATALLTVLLNQSGSPLIIDQPEDDIDNKAIDDIIKNIWEAKKKRQLIFASHNANLVVNGDAEFVVCFDYREAGNQTRGIVKAEGAIDFKTVRDEITLVMEGGEKAFKLRKEKYGF